MRFSEREGYRAPKLALTEEEIPDGLRNKIWTAICSTYFDKTGKSSGYGSTYSNEFGTVTDNLHFGFFERPQDARHRNPSEQLKVFRDWYFGCSFPDFYDFVEYLSGIRSSDIQRSRYETFCNRIFEQEKSVFRFANHLITKIVDSEEIKEVELAAPGNNPLNVRIHIDQALKHYRDRHKPDYRNAIKEAISVVEAACNYVTERKNSVVADDLKDIAKHHGLHSGFQKGLSQIYGYTSDAGGIRHSLMDADNLQETDARFMIVACSAFANYLIALKFDSGSPANDAQAAAYRPHRKLLKMNPNDYNALPVLRTRNRPDGTPRPPQPARAFANPTIRSQASASLFSSSVNEIRTQPRAAAPNAPASSTATPVSRQSSRATAAPSAPSPATSAITNIPACGLSTVTPGAAASRPQTRSRRRR
jgi:hypothetical protein